MMSAPSPAQAAPPPQRALRYAALGLQAVVATPILVLAFAAAPTPFRDQLQSLFAGWSLSGSGVPSASVASCVALGAVLVALGIFLASWRLQGSSWWRIGAGYAALGAVLAYLAHDDAAIRHPIKMEEFSPAFPGADTSFGVLMRYGREHPLGRGFKAPLFKNPYPNFVPEPPGPWRATLALHRTEIEAHWSEFAPLRAWLAELDSFGRIGDLTPATYDTEVIAFQPIRNLSQHGIAIASLQALDGHGDAAVDTLLPILRVGRALQPYSRTLVRSMIGVVIEHISLQTAAFILDSSAVSPAARARLAAALQGGDAAAGARHLLETEYVLRLETYQGMRLGDMLEDSSAGEKHPWRRLAFNAVSPFLYNPRASFNLYGDLFADLAEFNGRREPAQMDARMNRFITRDVSPGFKNYFGKLLAKMSTPAYSKVSANYWRNQDLRAALIERLARE